MGEAETSQSPLTLTLFRVKATQKSHLSFLPVLVQKGLTGNMPNRNEAERFLHSWGKDALNSGISHLIKLGKSILSHRTGILNYFDYPITCGKVEGINNKIKTLKRQVYGFRDMAYFTLRLYHLHEQNYSLSG